MKKWRLLLMVLLSLFLTGCAQSVEDGSSVTDGSSASGDETLQVSLPVLEMSDLRPVGTFREGRLFVMRKSDGATVCIDKEGHIQFQLPEGYSPYFLGGGGFYNGLAVVQKTVEDTNEPQVHLCKLDGTLVTPEEFGGVRFLFSQSMIESQQERFFADGYIMVEGSGQLGLLDSDLQWLVPMSAEYHAQISDFVQENTEEGWGAEFYYDSGRFLSARGSMDIQTGCGTEFCLLDFETAYPSDFWVEWRDSSTIMFQDGLSEDGKMALKLEGWLDAGDQIPRFTFEDGCAGVVKIREVGNTFTVIDEDGRQLFLPVRVEGEDCDYDPCSKLYCVDGIDQTGELVIQLFDTNGMKYEYVYDVPEAADHCSATVEDGVIMVCVRYDDELEIGVMWELFDLEYNKLY